MPDQRYREARNHLKEIFPSLILYEQNLFATEKGYEDLLKMIPDSSVVKSLRSSWEDETDRHSEEKWMDLYKIAKTNQVQSSLTTSLVN